MHAILYRSRARTSLLASDLNGILATAQARNRRLDITGLMLYGELEVVPGAPGEFVQWLEGPESAVETMYDTIRADRRHTEVEVLGRGALSDLPTVALTPTASADGRLFAGWDMGLVRLAELPATLDGFVRFAEAWNGQATTTA